VSKTAPKPHRPAKEAIKTSNTLPRAEFISSVERKTIGKGLRDSVARDALGTWQPNRHRPDPIAILRAADATRQSRLVPLRYGRMLQSPFTFYRGSAGIMAADLSRTPATGVHVQACGDAHLMNFGVFATPERRIIFDINDLDETLPAPWEWDVQRLAASFVLAARSNGLSDSVGKDAAIETARSYRQHMREFADQDVLEIWYARIDDSDFLPLMSPAHRAVAEKRITKAMSTSGSELIYPKLVNDDDGQPRIRDTPPTLFHAQEEEHPGYLETFNEVLDKYRGSLPEDRRALFDRFKLLDVAVKVVGVGSVGTLCLVALFISTAGRPFFLQIKEANASVLEAYAGASTYRHHGERVVMGQRLMQPASDLFLGWVTGPQGRQFYVRQLRDVKLSAVIETYDAERLQVYANACGWALARAHAKASDPWTIAGYLGKQDAFDNALGKFAIAYADQAERDHAALLKAVRAGLIDVELER
jgi:uncharacterized protein (DUF2252 family)